MKKIPLSIYRFLILLSINSCDYSKRVPGIQINSPVDGQIFRAGEVVEVKAKISDDGDSILNEELVVTSGNQDTIINFIDSKFSFEYTLSDSFTATSNSTYKIEVRARGGHGNWSSKIINVAGE